MTNCTLDLRPSITATQISDSSGRTTLTGTVVPSVALMVYAQAAHPEPTTNPANFVSTNMMSSIVGTSGLGDYVYNWTAFGPTAQYGPYYPTSYGQVLLLR